MRKLFRYLKKLPSGLLWLLLVAIVCYIAIEFLNTVPEMFKGASKIGQFFSKICIAYVTSFIFYFVVTHIKSQRDKESVGEYVAIRLSEIVLAGAGYFRPFSDKPLKELAASDLNRAILDSVNRFGPCKGHIRSDGTPLTWLEYYEKNRNDTFEALNVIYSRYNHLDAKLVKLLSRIEYSMVYYQWAMLYSYPSFDKSFGMFQMQLQTYLIALKELDEYATNNFQDAGHVRGEFLRTNEVLQNKKYRSSKS